MTRRGRDAPPARVLTADVALELLEQAVAQRGPDYRYSDHYPGPDYTDPDGNPACLVGLALHLFGVPAASLHTWDDAITAVFGLTYSKDPGGLPGRTYLPQAVAEIGDEAPAATEPAIRVLFAAQLVQDGSGTWGDALDTARAVHAALTRPTPTRDPESHQE